MMRIERTLKDDLREKADYANTATQVTNRIVKECKEQAERGLYNTEVYVEPDVVEEVTTNLKNELTNLAVENYVEFGNGNWYTISWED